MNRIVTSRLLLFILGAIISYTADAQLVKGKILDEEGNPLIGATIVVEGTTNGTFTDIDGNYTLGKLVAGTQRIKYSYIGFKSETKGVTLAAGEVKELNITLKVDAVLMDDVVVVGYGVQRKKEVTGSITRVDAKKISEIPAPSFEAALQGQAAGVQVSQGSGLAGSASLIKVRGIASVSAAGDPLYVVDGVPITQDNFLRGNSGAMNNNPLATINPNDIESIEILKDASATGIYGSRGANGVILITTKRGRDKGLKFDFTARVGIAEAATRPNMLTTEQYLQIRQEAWENDGGTGYVWLPNFTSANDAPDVRARAFQLARTINTNWVDETIGTGVKQMYSLGVSKGGDRYKAYASFSYDDNQSYLLGNSYERLSGRINLDVKIRKNITALLSSSGSRGQNNRVDAAWSGGLGDAMSNALPIYPVEWRPELAEYNFYNAGGYAMWKDEFGGDKNPTAFREFKDWRTLELRSINNLSIVWSPIKNLNLKASGGYDYMDIQEDVFNPGTIKSFTDISDANRSANLVHNWNYSVTADYRWELNENHVFGFLAGNEYQRSDSYGYGIYFPQAEAPIYDDSALEDEAANVNKTAGNAQIFSFLSYFGRVNYAIKGKYIFQATARVDGSSRFGRNNRYGFFPAVSAGWIVSDENFLKDNKTISYLKLRASFGETGNASFDNYAYIGTYSAADNGILYNGNPIIFPLNASNPDLRWETSQTFDAAIEVGLWKDRITGELAYYNKLSKDVLLNVNLPPSTGFTNYWDNVATVINRGVEFSFKSRNMVNAFQWTTEFNIARNYNELRDIGDYTPDAVSGGTNDSRVIVGKPIGSFYLVEFSRVDAATGLPVYLDLNGNETFEYDNANRRYVGDGLPEFIGGITNFFKYDKWDLNILATYSIGGKIFDSSSKRQMGVVTAWNMREEIFDRWTQPGDESTFPRLTLDETTYDLPSGFPWWNTSLFVFDASYVRLRQVTLGYNFEPVKRGKVEVNNIRLAFTVFNLLTVTDFPGLDPEVVRDFENPQDRNLSPNVTYLTPPQERSYNLQLSFNF